MPEPPLPSLNECRLYLDKCHGSVTLFRHIPIHCQFVAGIVDITDYCRHNGADEHAAVSQLRALFASPLGLWN